MSYDVCLPAREGNEKTVLSTLRFSELGLSVAVKRWRGKIKEIYVVDDILGDREYWGLEEEISPG